MMTVRFPVINIDYGVYIRSDHPPTRRLREHKPADDPAGEDAENDPKTDDEQEEDFAQHFLFK